MISTFPEKKEAENQRSFPWTDDWEDVYSFVDPSFRIFDMFFACDDVSISKLSKTPQLTPASDTQLRHEPLSLDLSQPITDVRAVTDSHYNNAESESVQKSLSSYNYLSQRGNLRNIIS